MIFNPVVKKSGGGQWLHLTTVSLDLTGAVDSTGKILTFDFPDEYDLAQLVGFGVYIYAGATGTLGSLPTSTFLAKNIRYLAGLEDSYSTASVIGIITGRSDAYAIYSIDTSNSYVSGKSAQLTFSALRSGDYAEVAMSTTATVQLSLAYLI